MKLTLNTVGFTEFCPVLALSPICGILAGLRRDFLLQDTVNMVLRVFGLLLVFVGVLRRLRFDSFNPASCSLTSVADFDYVECVSRVLNNPCTEYYQRAFQESREIFGDVSVSDSF